MARAKKKYHYIYKTTNLKNGTFYIGMHSTNDLNDGYLGSGTRLRRSIRRNGKENFKIEILEFFENRELLVEREKELVNDELLKDPLCMNLKPGGDGGVNNKKHGLKLSKGGISKRNWLFKNDKEWVKFYKKCKTDDNLKKPRGISIYNHLRYDWNGKTHTEETKQKMSEAKKGKGTGNANSQFGTMWVTNGTENKKIKKEEIIPTGWKRGRVYNKHTIAYGSGRSPKPRIDMGSIP